MGSQCSSLRKEEPKSVLIVNCEGDLHQDKSVILKLYKQLRMGCSNDMCQNIHCASNTSLYEVDNPTVYSAGDALMNALQLSLERNTQHCSVDLSGNNELGADRNKRNLPLKRSNKVLDDCAMNYVTGQPLLVSCNDVVNGFRDWGATDAFRLALLLFLTDAQGERHSDSMRSLGLLYAIKAGDGYSSKLALEWLIKSGETTESAMMQILAILEARGKRDDKKAVKELAEIYSGGIGVECNFRKVIEYLKQCEMKSDNEIYVEALNLLSNYAYSGNVDALREISIMRSLGLGSDQDYDAALKALAVVCDSYTHESTTDIPEDSRKSYIVKALQIVDCKLSDESESMSIDFETAIELLQKLEYPLDFSQQSIYERLRANSEHDDHEAMLALGRMFLKSEEHLTFLWSNVSYDDEDSKQAQIDEYNTQAADFFEKSALLGNIEAAKELALCYLHGVGRDIDFKEVQKWYEICGKERDYIDRRVKKKLDSLKPFYYLLFKAFDETGTDNINEEQFKEFYITCFQAKGLKRKDAVSRADGTYHGRPMYLTIFKSIDVDKNGGLDFEEIWSHPHVHTTLFPKVGEHVMACEKFLQKWKEKNSELVAQLEEQMNKENEEETGEVDGKHGRRPSVNYTIPKGSLRRRNSTLYDLTKSAQSKQTAVHRFYKSKSKPEIVTGVVKSPSKRR